MPARGLLAAEAAQRDGVGIVAAEDGPKFFDVEGLGTGVIAAARSASGASSMSPTPPEW